MSQQPHLLSESDLQRDNFKNKGNKNSFVFETPNAQVKSIVMNSSFLPTKKKSNSDATLEMLMKRVDKLESHVKIHTRVLKKITVDLDSLYRITDASHKMATELQHQQPTYNKCNDWEKYLIFPGLVFIELASVFVNYYYLQ